MGAARLLAKGWVVFCLFACAHAIHGTLVTGGWNYLPQIGLIAGCTFIFTAMGLLFAGGFGASGGAGSAAWLASLKPHDLLPGFNDWVFLGFVLLSFINQVIFAPDHISGGISLALERHISSRVQGIVISFPSDFPASF